jgi:NadR type nicotinamide-nucleotide adenylyltransferase
MSVFQHGLVIGKFYPPHRGHEYLIRSAAQAARHVTVVVMAADVESIALAQRLSWLEEMFAARANLRIIGIIDNERIDYRDDGVWQTHVAHMQRGIARAEALRGAPAGPVDAVFTSESYGEELARRLGAASVCLDQARDLYPVSSTAVRANPAQCWHQLPECVREHLCQRVVIVGAESTGKSTLGAALAVKLRERGGAWAATQCVAEYGREYTVNKLAIARALNPAGSALDQMRQLQWQSAEFEIIAREQNRLEHEAARNSGPVLICDTDALATGIWHERYIGERSNTVAMLARQSGARLGYILSHWREVPFQHDGLRDGEHLREWMHERFVERLTEVQAPWLATMGPLPTRVAQCLQWIDQQLASAWRFADPLEKRAAS